MPRNTAKSQAVPPAEPLTPLTNTTNAAPTPHPAKIHPPPHLPGGFGLSQPHATGVSI